MDQYFEADLGYLDAERLRPSEMSRYDQGMFHLTAHAMDDLHCFGDRRDKLEFLERFARVLSPEPVRDPVRRTFYPHLLGEASLVAFCVLENHYHLIIRQFSATGGRRLMRSVLTSYGHYFNDKYDRPGAQIYREEFTATRIASSVQGARTLAYVTLNHEVKREKYEFSSHDYYVGKRRASWLDVDSGLWFFGGDRDAYADYLADEGVIALEQKIARRANRPLTPLVRPRRGRSTHIRR